MISPVNQHTWRTNGTFPFVGMCFWGYWSRAKSQRQGTLGAHRFPHPTSQHQRNCRKLHVWLVKQSLKPAHDPMAPMDIHGISWRYPSEPHENPKAFQTEFEGLTSFGTLFGEALKTADTFACVAVVASSILLCIGSPKKIERIQVMSSYTINLSILRVGFYKAMRLLSFETVFKGFEQSVLLICFANFP